MAVQRQLNASVPLSSVFDATVPHQQRTNNEIEAWNNAFAGQVGHSHPLIDNLRKDNWSSSLWKLNREVNHRGNESGERRAISMSDSSMGLQCHQPCV